MSTGILACPSGLAVEVRKLKVSEADILAAARGAKSRPYVANKVFTACWLSTENVGPYQFDKDRPPEWDKVLGGDRDYILFQIRKLTFGPDYEFQTQCAESDCREQFYWQVNLDDLPVEMLSDEAREVFSAGNKFETVVPGTDQKLIFGLTIGSDLKRMVKLRKDNRERLATLALRMRIREIESVESQNLSKFIEDLGIDQMQELIERMDEPECGVDLEIEIECPQCFAIREVTLPLERTFFYPEARRKKKSA